MQKTIFSDTGWRVDDIPPRFSGVYEKTRPNRNGWKWRSVLAQAADQEYIFLTQVHEQRDNWSAWLILKNEGGASIVDRFEYHGSHPGLHIHAHCERGGIEEGPSSINDLVRFPKASSRHRRLQTYRPASFWEQARSHFRIDYPRGALL
ncbi:hypothetical protein [Mesorhizobium sp.]|uniref:hypothetical protein n=1 Tax=Mesorhizobium sp. TaxID=1871066 RepID=UPI000FE7F94C|nr:hypothetical protein [Mesorhizobium sp.]RWE97362.1 MAG: hypothetical protein EOS43_20505 [Mesorhizobium sp.]